MMSAAEMANHLGGKKSGQSYVALCPAHDDNNPSLSIREGSEGRILVHCHAGCTQEALIRVLSEMGLWPAGTEKRSGMQSKNESQRGGASSNSRRAHVHEAKPVRARGDSNQNTEQNPLLTGAGLNVAQYAEAKGLSVEWLREIGLSDVMLQGQPAVRIPYRDADGTEISIRFRLALEGGNRFRYKSGSKPTPYGLWRLNLGREEGYIVLAEGESDAHTLWYHDIPAVTLPGANIWREEWTAYLDDIPVIYVVIEPDQGGDAVLKWLSRSKIRERVRLIRLDAAKDPSELFLSDPEHFVERWKATQAAAITWGAIVEAQAQASKAAAWEQCAELAQQPDILTEFAAELDRLGVVGEERVTRLTYLVVTSRLLDRPLSAAVKGTSSAGKSYTTQNVMRFFPPEAYYALSGMSEHALAYSEEPLSHRILVIYEANGLQGEFASYLVRSLLSEGRISYETVEKTAEGLKSRRIEREGPTGLIVTTTAVQLHPENETRLLSIPVNDTPEQTKRIMLAMAGTADEAPVDLGRWHALQRWLADGDCRVVVRYAEALAWAIPPVATRLRRDFGALLALIRSHALLHRENRRVDQSGRVVATLADYAAIRMLVSDLVADGAGATVSPAVRETVQAVTEGLKDSWAHLTISQLAKLLRLDQSTASRRARAAIDKGFLVNLEDRKGRPAQLVLGEPLPDEVELLPSVEQLTLQYGADDCTLARAPGGTTAPLTAAGDVNSLLEIVI